MKEHDRNKGEFTPVLGNLALAILGLVIALIAVEMLMRAFPNWVPAEVRVNPPARRTKPFIGDTYDLRQSDGDLYHLMKGTLAPLSPDQDQVVARIHMVTDAHGFRNPPPEKDTYSIVALGDSFTRASGVPSPWPQKLAEYAGTDVLNLGDVAFGPQDELKVLQQYGLEKRPQWVIMAFFEGNDLYDAAAYELANPFILARFGRYLLTQGTEAWGERNGNSGTAAVVSSYRYPISVNTNDTELEMAFFSYYISWLSVSSEVIESSRNYRLATETVSEMKKLSDTAQAHFMLVYVPTKLHVYFPFLKDAEMIERVFTDVPTLGLDNAGYLQFSNRRATAELARQHMDDQSQLLADFAVEKDITYLDLTPYFQKEAAAGAELYYPYDTHWNQQGHDLAAETIALYLED